MQRREFIAGLGSAAAWPAVARAQQRALPVIGYLSNTTYSEARRPLVAAFHRALVEAGYVEGQNVAVEYLWGENRNDRLPALAADLVRQRVALIVTDSTPGAQAAKAASTTIPILFIVGTDPIETGLVDSLARPGGNITGFSLLASTVTAKRLELLHEIAPAATTVALLVNPTMPSPAAVQTREAELAARALRVNLLVLNASSEREIEDAFGALILQRAGALLVNDDNLFTTQANQLATLAARHAVPAIYAYRQSAVAGGLMSYAADNVEAWRQVGIYAGRILKGEKPADLPVQQSTKVELVINLRTAKALGLTVPQSILLRADGVIE